MLNITPNHAQSIGLAELRNNWLTTRTFLVSAPTGSGKTGLAAFITDGLIKHNKRILFIAPYTVLIEQTRDRFVQYGIDENLISIIWQKHRLYNPNKPIQIASADTLIRRELPTDVDLIIVDEAHLKRKKLLTYIKETTAKVIGLSGTPFATFLGHYYEKLIKPTSMKELIRLGELSPYEFYAPTKPNLDKVKSNNTSMGRDYNEDELGEIMGNADLVGNLVQNWLEHGQNLPTICFCVNVKHANFVTLQFRKHGVNAEVLTANTPTDERRLIIGRFELGITKIIVNVGVLVAGFDSDVRCIIYARPTKSEIRWVQCIGRGLRTAQGKDKCIVFDHSGTVHRLGFPDEIEYDTLPSKTDGMNNVQIQERKQAEKKPKECPECKFMKPIGVYTCPKCGYEPLANEDVETDETRSIQKISKGKRVYSQKEKQSWWSQILYYQHQIAQTKGKLLSDGWCAHVYRDKFGVWPKNLNRNLQETSPEVRNFILSKQIAYAKSQSSTTSAQQKLSLATDELLGQNTNKISSLTARILDARRATDRAIA